PRTSRRSRRIPQAAGTRPRAACATASSPTRAERRGEVAAVGELLDRGPVQEALGARQAQVAGEGALPRGVQQLGERLLERGGEPVGCTGASPVGGPECSDVV